MASGATGEKFDPEQEHNSVLEAFLEFISQFKYSYDALNRDPPNTFKEEDEIKTWKETDRRKVFLGRYSHRNLQKLYEEIVAERDRETMCFKDMVKIFTDRFKQSTNLSLANFKFRKLSQSDSESFEAFSIRVKREARNCDFKCRDGCTVIDTMIRDQILFGTRDEEVRKTALKEQWQLVDLLQKGRAIEASDRGAATIKQEPSEDIRRMKPGKYSKKNTYQKGGKSSYRRKNPDNEPSHPERSRQKCSKCSSPRCAGENRCPGKNATCFGCGLVGHFRGAEVCKKKSYTRRSRRVDEATSSERSADDSEASESDEPKSSTDEESEPDRSSSGRKTTKQMRRVFSQLSTIRRIGGRRYPNVRRAQSRYTINVIIKETVVPVFCDTGADICIISMGNAKQLDLDIFPTRMIVKPYGSKARKCIGETCCTVRFEENVVNTKFYIMEKAVETLISGTVCEELGIITMNTTKPATIKRTSDATDAKSRLMKKFPTIFKGVGSLRNYKVKFFVNKNVPPVYQPARPIPFHLREKMQKELQSMEDDDVIEQHHGPAPWVSNVVLSPKDDGALRITIDMRQANKAIKKTNLPIPRPEEISSQLSGYKVFSKLDFRSAFHQLEIDENSRLLTVFHANGKLMRYKRLTMGTTPASGELNKALRPIFHDIQDAHVIQDDLIIGGETQEQHDKTLESVCQRIQESGMTLNPDKCLISTDQIPWWGMMISKEGISPDPTKVDAVKHMTPPRSKDEVKSLFCMLQSNKNFIPLLASKTINIRNLLRKDTKFEWSKQCQLEFSKIKEEFSKDILLRHFDPKCTTEIHVDAHRSGLSALLVQIVDGEKNIVGVASRATTAVETRYPQIDLESLAVDFGLRRFRFYIAGGPRVTVVTDHKPLRSIFKNLRKGSIRSERIKLRHQDIDYEVKWEKGITNPADYLSRHATPLKNMPKHIEEETKELEKTVWFLQYSPYTEAISIQQLIEMTERDKTLKTLRSCLRKGHSPKTSKNLAPYSKVWDQLTISDSGLVLKGEKIVLPEELIDVAIKKAHQGGHPGMTSMKRRLRTHFWCPQLNSRVQDMVKNCNECAMFTPKNRKNLLHPHKLTEYNAWEKISVDLFGPMPDHRHIIVAQDMVSKFPAAKILNKTDAKHVTEALQEFYTSYGTPLIHRTDNGPPFNSKEFEAFSKQQAVHHEKALPYHPQANPVEAFMKPLGKCMKAAYSQNIDKNKALGIFLSTYRATPHSSTGIAPADILFRHGYGNVFPKTAPVPDDEVDEALNGDQETREDRDADMNLTRRNDEFQVGDRVITKNNGHTKFQPVYGPDPKTVIAIEDGGITCTNAGGTVQRRHQDDVKLAPDNTQIEQEQPERSTHSEASNLVNHNSRPVRTRKPSSRYNEKDFYLY